MERWILLSLHKYLMDVVFGKPEEGGGWGGACPSARVDRSGWVGLREGVRDEGEEPQAPSPQSTEKALKGKKKESKRMDEGKSTVG